MAKNNKSQSKTDFVAELVSNGKYTADQVADMLSSRWPIEGTKDEQHEKAMRIVRAIIYRLRQQGKPVNYLRAGQAFKTETVMLAKPLKR